MKGKHSRRQQSEIQVDYIGQGGDLNQLDQGSQDVQVDYTGNDQPQGSSRSNERAQNQSQNQSKDVEVDWISNE